MLLVVKKQAIDDDNLKEILSGVKRILSNRPLVAESFRDIVHLALIPNNYSPLSRSSFFAVPSNLCWVHRGWYEISHLTNVFQEVACKDTR